MSRDLRWSAGPEQGLSGATQDQCGLTLDTAAPLIGTFEKADRFSGQAQSGRPEKRLIGVLIQHATAYFD